MAESKIEAEIRWLRSFAVQLRDETLRWEADDKRTVRIDASIADQAADKIMTLTKRVSFFLAGGR